MSQRARVILAMLTLYIVWGTTYLGIKIGLDATLPPGLFSALRLLPAAGIMFIVARMRGASLAPSGSALRVVILVGILLLVGGQYGTMLAELYVPSGLSALVVAVVPLWIALAESVFPDMQRPGRMGWAGLAVGFTGLAILITPRLLATGASSKDVPGILVQIVATWLWTAGSVYSKRKRVDIDPIAATAWEMLAAGAVTLVIGTVAGEWSRLTFTPKGSLALLYLIVFGSCVAFTAFVYALHHLPASKVMTYAYVNPVIAVFAGWAAGRIGLVPSEPISPSMLIGMVVIVAGVAITTAAPTLPPRLSAAGQPAAPASVEVEPSEV